MLVHRSVPTLLALADKNGIQEGNGWHEHSQKENNKQVEGFVFAALADWLNKFQMGQDCACRSLGERTIARPWRARMPQRAAVTGNGTSSILHSQVAWAEEVQFSSLSLSLSLSLLSWVAFCLKSSFMVIAARVVATDPQMVSGTLPRSFPANGTLEFIHIEKEDFAASSLRNTKKWFHSWFFWGQNMNSKPKCKRFPGIRAEKDTLLVSHLPEKKIQTMASIIGHHFHKRGIENGQSFVRKMSCTVGFGQFKFFLILLGVCAGTVAKFRIHHCVNHIHVCQEHNYIGNATKTIASIELWVQSPPKCEFIQAKFRFSRAKLQFKTRQISLI